MTCLLCMLLGEVDPDDRVATFQGTTYCRRHYLLNERPRAIYETDEAWVESMRRTLTERAQ